MVTLSRPGAELARARGLFAAVVLFSICVNLLVLTGPIFMLQVYDRVLNSRSEETLLTLFVLVAVLFAAMGLLDHLRGRVLSRIGLRLQVALDRAVFERALQTQNDSRAGSADMDAVRGLFGAPVLLAILDVPWTPIFVVAIFIFHPALGWLAIAGGGLLVVAAMINHGLTQRSSVEGRRRTLGAEALFQEAQAAQDLVFSQGMADTLAARWTSLREAALVAGAQSNDLSGAFAASSKALRLFLQSAMLALGAWLVIRGELSAGAMVAVTILLGRALAPVEQVVGQWGQVQRALQGWSALRDLLPAQDSDTPPLTLPRPEARLSIRGLAVRGSEAGKPLLSGITLDIAPGEVLGVIGKSGSGKSTLARAALGLVEPQLGEVRLGGATLTQYGPDLGQHIGYLPQDTAFFSGTIAENIARMARSPEARDVVAAARAAGAHELILSLPEGYQTPMGSGAPTRLSGGQRQRIALARALFGDPVLLVLDEPNSALDAEGAEALNRAIRDFKASGRAVLLMTHRPAALSECDRLAVIDRGRLRAQGPRDEVLRTMVQSAERGQSDLERTA
jgi:PrtD family type I secretion system ABC transporter